MYSNICVLLQPLDVNFAMKTRPSHSDVHTIKRYLVASTVTAYNLNEIPLPTSSSSSLFLLMFINKASQLLLYVHQLQGELAAVGGVSTD